eukprot:CAMPEP_0202902956 /NCGR_PEP_ID=MMETSP1392-20130828/19646_1 /ASSEMBLY_ACC=CAM_ASM_000868 /TAXON_ID=225041 /ORGANISM="Chlamydomonas chlamydogama, Strain SAG 11-48b" /LENGTH=481 /DNA_ID=CAMNT_0049589861 /DNA_START=532 /DNA_END=1977 /DNA_ORIENTATION=-
MTPISLNQVVDEGVGAAGPMTAVADCNGKHLPLYGYAVQPSVKVTARRTASVDAFAVVPDVDDSSSKGSDDDDTCSSSEVGVVPQNSVMDTVLLALWEDAAEQGLFRYDVTACPTKVLPGIYGFIAQLNEGRATKKRPTEFRVDQVCQPFDETKFNFKKAFMREVLFQFEPSRAADGHAQLQDAVASGPNPNLVLINVSPIEYGHVLLVPRVMDNIPQLVDTYTVQLALHFAKEADNPYFRVGYNSLGAYATINHLHFQAYYLAAPFPCERASTAPIKGLKRKRGNVQVSRLLDYPVNGFVVEVGNCLQEMAEVVATACVRMQQANIPHNLLITDSGSRVFIWPQCYAEKQAQGLVPEELLDTGVNPAVFEIAGHLVMKRKQDYDDLSQDLAWRLLEQVSLPEDRFMEVAKLCFGSDCSKECMSSCYSFSTSSIMSAPSHLKHQFSDLPVLAPAGMLDQQGVDVVEEEGLQLVPDVTNSKP